MTLIEFVAAALLVLGSFLVIRAVIAADQVGSGAAEQGRQDQADSSYRRAA